MRLIDADATFDLLRSLGSRDYRRENGTIMDAMKMISHPEYTPTVDAVTVVRCKECKHWLCVEDGFGDCTNRRFHLDGCADPSMKMDDFCSCGEKRGV